MREKELEKLKDYKYGFTTDIENIRAPKGVNKEVIQFIFEPGFSSHEFGKRTT